MNENEISLSEIERNLDLILKNDSKPENIKQAKEAFESNLLGYFLKETKQELNSIIDRKIAQKLYNVGRSKQIKAEIEKIVIGDFALSKRKKLEGLTRIVALFQKKQTQRKTHVFFLICPRIERDDSKNQEIDEKSMKKFQALKSAFQKFHKSKRNKFKSLLYRLDASSENLISQSRSLMFSWKGLLHKRKIGFLANTLHLALVLSHILRENHKILLKSAFSAFFSLKKSKETLVLKVKSLIERKKKDFFMGFRILSVIKSTENSSNKLMRLYFSIDGLIKKRMGIIMQGLKRKNLRKIAMGIKRINGFLSKNNGKMLVYSLNRLQEKRLNGNMKNTAKNAKISRFFEILLGIYRKSKNFAFFKVKFNKLKPTVKKLLRIYQNKLRDFIRRAFFKWRSNLIVKKIAQKNLTNRVKGKILLSFSRNESNLSLKTSFNRWKVKSNKSLLKNTMDRFALTAKISLLTVYFRFRSLLEPEKRRKQGKSTALISKKKLMGLIRLIFMLMSKQKSFKILAFQRLHLKKLDQRSLAITRKCLSKLLKGRLLKIYLFTMRKWSLAIKEQSAKQRFFSIVQRSTYSKVLQIFSLWRNAGTVDTGKRRASLSQILYGFIHKNHQFILGKLLSLNQLAKTKKTVTIRVLLDATVNQTEKAFNRWVNYTISSKLMEKTLLKSRILKKMVETIEIGVGRNVEGCFLSTRGKKIAAGRVFEGLVRILYRKERDFMNKMLKFANKNEFQSKLYRGNGIKAISNAIGENFKKDLAWVIEKFDKNAKANRIFKGFFNMLKDNREGLAEIFFENSFKNSPRYRLIGRRFEPIMRLISGINLEGRERKEEAFRVFIRELQRGKEIKAKAIGKIIEKYREKMKKSIENLGFFARKNKENEKKQHILEVFEILNEIIAQNTMKNLLLRNMQEKLKNRLLKKLVINNQAKKREAFLIWLGKTHGMVSMSNAERDGIRRMKAVFSMETQAKKMRKGLLGNIMDRFHRNAVKRGGLGKIIEKNRKKYLRKGFQRILGYSKAKIQGKIHILERNIEKMIGKRLGILLSDVNQREKAKKHGVLRKGAENCFNLFKKSFEKWALGTKIERNMRKLKGIRVFMETMNNKIMENLGHFLGTGSFESSTARFEEKLREMVILLSKRIKINKIQAFSHWKGVGLLNRLQRNSEKISNKNERKLEFGLNLKHKLEKMTRKPLEITLERLKMSNFTAENRRNELIKLFMRKNIGKLGFGVEFWRKIAKIERNNEKNKRILSIFEVLNGKLAYNLEEILKKSHLEEKKALILPKIAEIIKERLKNNRKNDVKMAFLLFRRGPSKDKMTIKGLKILEKTFNKKLRAFLSKIKLFTEFQPDKTFKKANNLLKNLGKITKKSIKTTFDILKEKDADALKENSMKKLIEKSHEHLKEGLRHWRIACRVDKQQQKNRGILKVFEEINEVFKENLMPLVSMRDWKKKAEAAKRIGVILGRKILGQFRRKTMDIIHVTKTFNEMVRKIEGFLGKKQEEKCREIIRKFKENRDFGNFIRKIVKNSENSIKKSFFDWKNREKSVKKQLDKSQGLFNVLDKAANRHLRGTFNDLKTGFLDFFVKKPEILKKMAENIRKTLEFRVFQWRKQAKFDKNMEISRFSMIFFENLNEISRKNIRELFENAQRDKENFNKKMLFMRRLIDCSRAKLIIGFNTWRVFSDNLSKKHEILRIFRREAAKNIVKTKDFLNLRENQRILACFKRNFNRKKAWMNFLEKLQEKNHGFLRKSFNIIKNIGKINQNSMISKGERLKKQLNFSIKRLFSNTFSLMKEHFLFNLLKKSKILEKIVINLRENQRKTLITWLSYKNNEKTQELHRKTILFYNLANEIAVRDNLQVLFAEASAEKISRKEAILIRIFANFREKTRKTLKKWSKTDKKHQEKAKKAFKISQMSSFYVKFANFELKNVLFLFLNNRNRIKSLISLQNRLSHLFSNEIEKTFKKWHEIPEKRISEYEKPSNLMKTLRIFKKIAYFDLRKTLVILNRDLIKGRQLKILASKTVFSQFSQKKRDFFINWKENTRKSRILSQATSVIKVFEGINAIFSNEMRLLVHHALLEDRRRDALLRSLMTRFKRNLRENLLIWLGNAQLAKVESKADGERFEVAVHALEKEFRRLERKDLKGILRKFNKNREFWVTTGHLHSLMVRFGESKVLFSFRQWKNMGKNTILAEKAAKFSQKIEKLLINSIKASFFPLKSLCEEVSTVRLQAMTRLFERLKGIMQEGFSHWRGLTRNNRNNLLMRKVLDLFGGVDGAFRDRLGMLFREINREKIGVNAIKRMLIIGGKSQRAVAFGRWKGLFETSKKNKGIFEIKAKFALNLMLKGLREYENNEKSRILMKFYKNMQKIRKITRFSEILHRKITRNLRDAIINLNNYKQINKRKSPHERLLEFLMKNTLLKRKSCFEDLKKNANNIKQQAAIGILNNLRENMRFGMKKWKFEEFKAKNQEKINKNAIFFEKLQEITNKNLSEFLIDKKMANSKSFIMKITKIHRKRLEKSLETLKNPLEISAATLIKRDILLKLLVSSSSLLRDYFSKWRHQASQINRLSKLKNLLIMTETFQKHPSATVTIIRRFRKNREKILTEKPGITSLFQAISHLITRIKSHVFHKFPQKNLQKSSKTQLFSSQLSKLFLSRKRFFLSKLLSTHKTPNKIPQGFFLLLNFYRNRLLLSFERIRHQAEIHIVKTYLNSLWKWKLANMESRYYSLVARQNKKTTAVALIQGALQGVQRNILKVPFKNMEFKNRKIRTVLSGIAARLFSMRLYNFYKWRVKALEISRNMLKEKNSRFFLGMKILGFLKSKKNKEIACFFKKWLLEKNKAKITQKILVKQGRNTQKNAFYIWKLRVFSSKNRFKAMQLYLALEKHEKNERKLGFFSLKLHQKRLSQGHSLLNLIFSVSGRILKKLVFDRFKRFSQANSSQTLSRIRSILPIILTHRRKMLSLYFSHWKSPEIMKKLKNLVQILENKRKFQLKTGFDLITHIGLIRQSQSRLKGLIKLLLFGSNIEKFRLRNAFQMWRDSDPNRKNPWFIRAIGILAKDSMLNPQIAYWRMRDYRRVARLTAPQIVKLKKMVNNITKAYETVMSMAFWKVENRKMRVSNFVMNSGNNSIIKKIQARVLGDVLIKYNPMVPVSEAFERLRDLLPLFRRINSNDLGQMFHPAQIRNLQIIGSAFQLVFAVNKILSNMRIKLLNFSMKKLGNYGKNGFYSPVGRVTEGEEAGEEVEHLKEMVEVSAKELGRKEEELNAAQECIEIIHEKLKQILVKKLVEIVNGQINGRKIEAFEGIKGF